MYYIVYNNKTPTLSVNLKRAPKLAVLLHTDFKDRHDGTGAIKRDHGGFNRRLIESFNERIKSTFFNKSSATSRNLCQLNRRYLYQIDGTDH